MTRTQWIDKTKEIVNNATDAGITKAQATEILTAIQTQLKDEMKNGEKVSFIPGTVVSVVDRAERKCKNPQTGEEMIVPAKKGLRVQMNAEGKRIYN